MGGRPGKLGDQSAEFFQITEKRPPDFLKQTIGRVCEFHEHRYEHLAPVFWALTCDTCKALSEVFSSLSALHSAGNFRCPLL